MIKGGQKSRGSNFQLSASFPIDYAYGSWQDVLEITPPPPWLTHETLATLLGRGGTKETALPLPILACPQGPSREEEGSPVLAGHTSASPTSPAGLQVTHPSFPCHPQQLRDFKFQPQFQNSQLLLAYWILLSTDWVRGQGKEIWSSPLCHAIYGFLENVVGRHVALKWSQFPQMSFPWES